jgi:xylulokinase
MLLGLDLGTGSCKALLLSAEGLVLGEASRTYGVRSPQAGWAESNPLEWWEAIGLAAREAVGIYGAEVRGIGLSGQMHGTVLCDAQSQPIQNAILWSDTRSSSVLGEYQKLSNRQLERLGNPIVAGMMGATLLWYKENLGLEGIKWALLPKDWLRFCLTGVIATEPSDACATLLYDLEQDNWAWDVFESLELPRIMPEVLVSTSIAGGLTPEAAMHLGLRTGIPVAAGGGDTPCAMLGNGIIDMGTAQLSVGTGAQIIVPTAKAQFGQSTHCYRTVLETNAKYYAMSAMQNAGLALERVRNWLSVDWLQFHGLAFSVPDTQNLIFLPYLSGERTPHLNPNARGAFLNLGLQHEKTHLARAALEGVAFSIADGLSALEQTGLVISELQLVGGGTLEPRWQQLLCNILEKPLFSSGTSNASARGAALLAALSIGLFKNALETTQMLPNPKLIAQPEANLEVLRLTKAKFRAAYTRA